MLTLVITIFSCASEASMQKYYIDHQDQKSFRAIDIPASVITIKDDASPDAKAAFKSLKKLNVLAFVKNESNVIEFNKEQQNVKTILKDKRYNELMRIKDKGMNLVIKYEGTDDAIDEVYIYASDKDKGFAVVRMLGENMKPEHLAVLMKSIKDIDNDSFKDFGSLIKRIK